MTYQSSLSLTASEWRYMTSAYIQYLKGLHLNLTHNLLLEDFHVVYWLIKYQLFSIDVCELLSKSIFCCHSHIKKSECKFLFPLHIHKSSRGLEKREEEEQPQILSSPLPNLERKEWSFQFLRLLIAQPTSPHR